MKKICVFCSASNGIENIYFKEAEILGKLMVENGFSLVSESQQTRTIFRKADKTMARITEDKTKNCSVFSLDFKEDKLSSNVLNVRKESKALVFDDLDAVLSVLDFLNYSKDNVLNRTRFVFEKDSIICEIDIYDFQKDEVVVSIEGQDYVGVDAFYKKFMEYTNKNE